MTLTIIRSVILVAALTGLLLHKRTPRWLIITGVVILLLLNLTGLGIAYTLVNHA